MTVKEALRFFAGQTRLLDKLAVLDEIGLGYLRLGQSATTLSGGEAQRVKMAAHLSQVRAANAVAKPSQASRVRYILDEPTTGLHFDDVSKLLTAFRKLIDAAGVHRITFMPFCAASATFFSSQSNWNLPSSGSRKAQANSPMWTYSMQIGRA